jgi:hypothetical protein
MKIFRELCFIQPAGCHSSGRFFQPGKYTVVVTQREFQKTQHVNFEFVAGDIF